MNLYLNSLFTITPVREIRNDSMLECSYEDTNNDNTACGSDMSECTCHNRDTCNTQAFLQSIKTPVGLHAH